MPPAPPRCDADRFRGLPDHAGKPTQNIARAPTVSSNPEKTAVVEAVEGGGVLSVAGCFSHRDSAFTQPVLNLLGGGERALERAFDSSVAIGAPPLTAQSGAPLRNAMGRAAAPQRKEPVASTRFLAAQFHECDLPPTIQLAHGHAGGNAA